MILQYLLHSVPSRFSIIFNISFYTIIVSNLEYTIMFPYLLYTYAVLHFSRPLLEYHYNP